MKRDVELGLISCICQDNTVMVTAENKGLSPRDFSYALARQLYSMCYVIWVGKNQAIDEITLRGEIALVEGPFTKMANDAGFDKLEKLFQVLFHSSISLENAEHFAKTIVDDSITRALNNGIDKVVGIREGLNAEQLTGELESVLSVIYKRLSAETVMTMGGEPKSLFQQMKEIQEREITGLASGWNTFDRQTLGWEASNLYFWVAPSGTGKSASRTNLMKNIGIDQGHHIGIISTEMMYHQELSRLISCCSGVKERQLRLNKGWQQSTTQFQQVEKACNRIDAAQTIHFLTMPDFSASKIRGHAIRMKMQYDIKMLLFENLGEPDEKAGDRQEWQNIPAFMWQMKTLAQFLKIPILVYGQTPIIVGRDTLREDDIALAKYSRFHVDYQIGQINKLSSTIHTERDLSAAADYGNQKVYILKGRHGGETIDEDQQKGYRYINFQLDRDCIRFREASMPHHSLQKKN